MKLCEKQDPYEQKQIEIRHIDGSIGRPAWVDQEEHVE